MHGHDDAFGDALLDALAGGRGEHVVERDDGRILALLSADVYLGGADSWASIEAHALDRVLGRVLDIGAGGGRFSLEAQARGHDVTAIDDSAGAVEVCRARGVSDVVHASFHRYAPDDRFDTFLMMGHNLGLLAPDPGRSLDRIRSMASPGAQIIGTTRDPYATDDPNHLAYHEANRDRRRMPGHLVMRIRREMSIGPWFDYLFCSEQELGDLASSAGWGLEIAARDDVRYLAVLTMR